MEVSLLGDFLLRVCFGVVLFCFCFFDRMSSLSRTPQDKRGESSLSVQDVHIRIRGQAKTS